MKGGSLYLLVAFHIFICLTTFAQIKKTENYPRIGKKCPDFALNEIHYYNKSKVTLIDFKSKGVILDFFSTGCTACFRSFPVIDTILREFRDSLQYLLVGNDDKYIRASYEKYRERFSLEFPVAYDSMIFKHFKITAVPFVIWIDKYGIIRAITGSEEVTRNNIRAFLNGDLMSFLADYSHDGKIRKDNLFDPEKPFLIAGNGGSDSNYLFRSILSMWNNQMPQAGLTGIDEYKNFYPMSLQLVGQDLAWLFRFAYFGVGNWSDTDVRYISKYSKRLVLRIRDSSLFKYDFASGKNIFCYSQIIPKRMMFSSYMLNVMRRDLSNYFGFDVKVVRRMSECYELISTDEARENLKSKKKPIKGEASFSGIAFANLPIGALIDQLRHFLSIDIVDGTNINYNVDFKMQAAMTDLEDVKRELRKEGLDLIKTEKEMNTIVVSDYNQ